MEVILKAFMQETKVFTNEVNTQVQSQMVNIKNLETLNVYLERHMVLLIYYSKQVKKQVIKIAARFTKLESYRKDF